MALNYDFYKKLNPFLNIKEINEIANLTLEYLECKSYLSQVKRIKADAEKLDALENTTGGEYRFLTSKIVGELSLQYTFEGFNLRSQVALRVFSSESNKIPYPFQIRLLQKILELEKTDPIQYKNCMIHAIMGAGKTTVIATILLYLLVRDSEKMPSSLSPPTCLKV